MTAGSGGTRRSLSALAPAAEVSAVVNATAFRQHGAALSAFAPLLRLSGRKAAADIVRVQHALTRGLMTASDATLLAGWDSLRNLAELANKLPPAKAASVCRELERQSQALLAAQDDFALLWTESAAAERLKRVKARADQTLAALQKASNARKAMEVSSEAAVLGTLVANTVKGEPELAKLWNSFLRVASLTSPSVLSAAKVAAKRCAGVAQILARKGPLTETEFSQLWSHLSKVRGELGEGYAFGTQRFLRERDKELARASAIALKLGPGHEVKYVTQLEHSIKINGAEGPDAMVLVFNRKTGQMYDPTRIQVKTAAHSEGVEQSIRDGFRSAGHERRGIVPVASCELRLTQDGPVEHFMISSHPDVTTRSLLINAGGAKIPREDLEALRSLGMRVDELDVGMNIEQFTHLAISLMEAALDTAKAAAKAAP